MLKMNVKKHLEEEIILSDLLPSLVIKNLLLKQTNKADFDSQSGQIEDFKTWYSWYHQKRP